MAPKTLSDGAVRAACVLALLLTVLPARGADATGDCTVRIRRTDATGFPRVTCHLSVTDQTGAALPGLAASDFAITENGSPVANQHCEQKRVERFAVALVIDRSGSMQGQALKAAQAAAKSFVQRMGPSDLCAVVSFAADRPGVSTFTSDKAVLAGRIASLRAGGWTALHDAVFLGVQQLKTLRADRRAVVALSDGRDNRSTHTLAQAITSATTNGVEVYTIGTGAADRGALDRLADETRGLSLYSASAADLVECYRSIFGAITTTYALTYDAPHAAGEPSWRTVAVKCHNGSHGGEGHATYNVPSGLAGDGGTALLADPVTLLVAGAILANLLLAGVLLRRRGARRSVVGR